MNSDFLDRLIYVVIMLFILSVITEKFTTLGRQYPSQCRTILILLSSIFYLIVFYSYYNRVAPLPKTPVDRNISQLEFWILLSFNTIFLFINILHTNRVQNRNKPDSFIKRTAWFQNIHMGNTSSSMREAEREITAFSFLIGFVIAYLFNVDLISLILEPYKKLSWDASPFIENSFHLNSEYFGFDPVKSIGFILTGFFLSFGSKFFHDLLDILFEVKNLKKKANDEALLKSTSITAFDKNLKLKVQDVVKITLENYAEKLMQNVGVHGVSCSTFLNNGSRTYGINVYTSAPDLFAGQTLTYSSPDNPQIIPIHVIEQQGEAIATSEISMTISNENQINFGTICIGVQEMDQPARKFLLTCYHCVISNKHAYEYFIPSNTENDNVHIAGALNGVIYKGIRNHQIDAALIMPIEGWKFKNTFQPKLKKQNAVRPVYYLDDDVTDVIIFGAATGHKVTGTITGVSARHKIRYNEDVFELTNLFEIQANQKPVSKKGDSGALVVTSDGEAIGMVVAANDYATLAIPLHTILNTWRLKLDI